MCEGLTDPAREGPGCPQPCRVQTLLLQLPLQPAPGGVAQEGHLDRAPGPVGGIHLAREDLALDPVGVLGALGRHGDVALLLEALLDVPFELLLVDDVLSLGRRREGRGGQQGKDQRECEGLCMTDRLSECSHRVATHQTRSQRRRPTPTPLSNVTLTRPMLPPS